MLFSCSPWVGLTRGTASTVPDWSENDFDSIYVLRFDREGGEISVTFTHDSEGLNDQAARVPMIRVRA
jgi:hypothetical protein